MTSPEQIAEQLLAVFTNSPDYFAWDSHEVPPGRLVPTGRDGLGLQALCEIFEEETKQAIDQENMITGLRELVNQNLLVPISDDPDHYVFRPQKPGA